MPTPKALLYRQKDKLLRLIVFKVQKSGHQPAVGFKHKLKHTRQVAFFRVLFRT